MSITVAEKTHWKERIEQKIQRAITELVEQHDPTFMQRITEEAATLAIESLGGTQYVSELKSLENKQALLEDEIRQLEQRLSELAKKAGVKRESYYSNHRNDISHWNAAVDSQRAVAEKKLLSRNPLGQRILTLRKEKESLLDTVWLSTSSVQIRELWKNVTELTSGELPELQKQILTQTAKTEVTK